MTEDHPTQGGSLVPSADKPLTTRSATLVRRTLADLSIDGISEEQIEHLCFDLSEGWLHVHDKQLQRQSEAARALISIAPRLDLGAYAAGQLLFCLLHGIEGAWLWVPYRVLDSTVWQDHYDLLWSALRALVGPAVSLRPVRREETLGEYDHSHLAPAVLAALARGATATKINAADWLARENLRLGREYGTIKAEAGALLREHLLRSQDEELLLALKHALVAIEQHDPDPLYRHLARSAIDSDSEAVRQRARAYMNSLAITVFHYPEPPFILAQYPRHPQSKVSQQTHWDANFSLAHDYDNENAQLGAAALLGHAHLPRDLAHCHTRVLQLILTHGLNLLTPELCPSAFFPRPAWFPPDPAFNRPELRHQLAKLKQDYYDWKSRFGEVVDPDPLWRQDDHPYCELIDMLILLIDELDTRTPDPSQN